MYGRQPRLANSRAVDLAQLWLAEWRQTAGWCCSVILSAPAARGNPRFATHPTACRPRMTLSSLQGLCNPGTNAGNQGKQPPAGEARV